MLPVNTARTCNSSGQTPVFPREKEDRVAVRSRENAGFFPASGISSIETGDLRGFWKDTLFPVGDFPA